MNTKIFTLFLIATLLPLFSFATIASITGSTVVCQGQTDSLSDITPGGTWSSSTTSIATVGSSTGVVSGVDTGTATITYTVGSSYVTLLVTVHPIPMLSSTPNPPPVCNRVGFIYVPASTVPGTSFTWYVSSEYGVANPTESGTGSIIDTLDDTTRTSIVVPFTYILTAGGCTSTAEVTVTIDPVVVPSVSITASPTLPVPYGALVTFSAIPYEGGLTPAYQWTLNGTAAAVTDTYAYHPFNGDLVQVCMTSSQTCAIPATVCSSDTMVVLPTTNIEAVPADNNVSIFPNPAHNAIFIHYNFVSEGQLQLTDILGQQNTIVPLPAAKQEKEIDMTRLPPGLYLYKITQNNALISTGKIIKL